MQSGGPFGIPHAFRFLGETWRVQWRNQEWDREPGGPHGDDSELIRSERLILMHRKLLRHRDPVTRRPDPELVWECFLHEVLHIIDEVWSKKRGRTDRFSQKRLRWHMSHQVMHRLDEPLAKLMLEGGLSFPCVCRPCAARRAG